MQQHLKACPELAVDLSGGAGRFALWMAMLAWLITAPAAAQQLGKPEDLRPFVRPKPLCSFAGTEPKPVLLALVSLVEQAGFATTETNWSDGQINADRKDGVNSDRLILWIERDLVDPGSSFKVFFMYGRFEKFLGSAELVRVQVSESFETQQIGKLRDAILKKSAGSPNQ